jgi:hypothetical protein
VLGLLLVIEFWLRKTVRFPRVNREQVGLIWAACSSAFNVAYCAWDPFRAYSSGGNLTVERLIGLSVVSNMLVAMAVCGWLIIFYAWIAVRVKRPLDNFECIMWTTYLPLCAFVILAAIGTSYLSYYYGIWADYAYYALIGETVDHSCAVI